MGNTAGPAPHNWVAQALRLMDDAVRAYERDPDLSGRLTDAARLLLGTEALLAIADGGADGQLPRPGQPAFQQLIQYAEAGEVDVATVLLLRNHQWVPAAAPATPVPDPAKAPIRLKDELTAMGLLSNTPPPSAADAAVSSPRPVTPAGGPIPWEPPGQRQAPGGEEPKLAVEIIPTSLHGKNPRTHFGREWWDAARKSAYAKAGYRCEICGGRGSSHPVELHERYSYDEHARPPVQRCTGLIVLCPACHAVKHLYRTSAVADENNNPAILDDALRHLREVNGWTEQQLQRYLKQVRRDYERREALGPWTADYSALSP